MDAITIIEYKTFCGHQNIWWGRHDPAVSAGSFRWNILNPFNPALAGRALILRSLLRNNDDYFLPRQLAARWLIKEELQIAIKTLAEEL
jgi:hypothetical protein